MGFMLFGFSLLNTQQKKSEYSPIEETICPGEIFSFRGSSVKFKKVISDSRCPKQVSCIWAGEVKLLLEFFEDGTSLGEHVVSGINIPFNDFFGKDNVLSSLKVYPYPEINDTIEPSEYSLQLKISENRPD